MNVYQAEIFDLNLSYSVALSRFKPFWTLAFGLFIFTLGAPFIPSVFTTNWWGQFQISGVWLSAITAAFILFVCWAVLLGLSLIVQATGNFLKAMLGSTRIDMTPTHLLIGKFELLWSEIVDLRFDVFSIPRGPNYSYMTVIHQGNQFTSDPTSSSSIVNFWLHRRKFFKVSKYRVATTTFVPIDFFEARPRVIEVLAKRYWSKANGRNYVPESLELMYSQKKFSDYKK